MYQILQCPVYFFKEMLKIGSSEYQKAVDLGWKSLFEGDYKECNDYLKYEFELIW